MTQKRRFATGVPGLDAVLGGNFLPGSLIVLSGSPGAGKTVLASQLIFAAAQQGRHTIIFTLYSEGQTKLLQHLRSFTFFDATLVGKFVTLLSLPDLLDSDVTGASAAVIRTIREHHAKLVLIDGLQSVGPILDNPQALRLFLASLSSQLSYIDASILATLTGDARDPRSNGILTAADVLIGLNYQLKGSRHQRSLEVVKQRGRAQLSGRHAYRLDGEGVTIFPRIEVYPRPQARPLVSGRVPFGLAELDALLDGGLTTGTTTVLAGAPGTGKTTLALYWALHNATPEAPAIVVTFREQEEQLTQKAAAFGLDLHAAIASGAVRVQRVAPVELNVDALGVQIITALERQPARLIIDDLAPLVRELGPRAYDYFAALAEHLYAAQVTTLALLEIAPFVGFRLNLENSPLSSIGENVLLMQHHAVAGALHRVLAVLGMRLSSHDRTLREFVINAEGVRVLPVDETKTEVVASAATGH